jgi:hypothetical protein
MPAWSLTWPTAQKEGLPPSDFIFANHSASSVARATLRLRPRPFECKLHLFRSSKHWRSQWHTTDVATWLPFRRFTTPIAWGSGTCHPSASAETIRVQAPTLSIFKAMGEASGTRQTLLRGCRFGDSPRPSLGALGRATRRLRPRPFECKLQLFRSSKHWRSQWHTCGHHSITPFLRPQ